MNVLMDVPDSKVETYSVHDYIYTQERFPAIYKILGIVCFLNNEIPANPSPPPALKSRRKRTLLPFKK